MDQPTGVMPHDGLAHDGLAMPVHLLGHHLYEYSKGVRPMVMMTLSTRDADTVTRKLAERFVDYHVQTVTEAKVNVFFGNPACVAMVRSVVRKPLNQLTPEEDFILGTLLGYDREQQCRRFLAMAHAGREGAGREGAGRDGAVS
ncbi:DUF2023 family protein [Azospirillum argentinense]|uniref:DUF2023 domain-containing protein n=2 Tax=Azospirillum argentinense TaxID=2970906 RepID=A0A5B0KXB4_9PROT|nr:hypothetical protein FH063_005023 [Azospirillum argentinense]